MIPASTHRAGAREGNVMGELQHAPAKVWPDRCPDCGHRMEFRFHRGTVARWCQRPICGRRVRAEDLR